MRRRENRADTLPSNGLSAIIIVIGQPKMLPIYLTLTTEDRGFRSEVTHLIVAARAASKIFKARR